MPLHLDTTNTIKLYGNIGKTNINRNSFVDFDKNGIKIDIEPNWRGKGFAPSEYLVIYCITEIMFSRVIGKENQKFQWDMVGDGFALYGKIDDFREPPVILLSFDKIQVELMNKNSIIYFKLHLEHEFDEPYYNPLYENTLMIDKGLFEINLTLEIPFF